jgi:hypothetical protein
MDARTKEATMYLSRFNHAAARDAAIEQARALHTERLQISLAGLFDDGQGKREIERRIAELELRENALWRFAEDPYAADSLQQIFDLEDRAVLLEAGRPAAAGGALAAAAA